jgi:glycine dehydrogenase subunit 2
VVHRGGGQVYCDGANFNALLGRARPGDWGVDVMQFNLHKTFSTPHGGGGPGSGPVGFKAHLEAFQPVPVVVRRGEAYALEEARERPRSVGRLRTFFGNFGMLVRAYAYVRELGAEGLTRISGMAVLNANYLRVKLEDRYHVAYPGTCMHEVVFSDRHQKAHGVTTLDVAKRLMDKGYHPPTVYFPLVVPGALMTEPTESETRRSLDEFVAAMREIADEAERDPELLHAAPHLPVRRRFDEAAAARRPVLVWRPDGEGEGDGGVTAGEGA